MNYHNFHNLKQCRPCPPHANPRASQVGQIVSAKRARVEVSAAVAPRKLTPALPVAGNQVVISYDANGGPLNGSSAMDIHVGFRVDGTDWVGTTTVPMSSLGGGVFSRTVSIPENAEAVNCVFRNQGNTWDNNNQNDWTIEVQAVTEAELGDSFIVY